jgi:zeta-carotene isomerase
MMTGTQHTMAMWQMVGQFLWCFAHTLWIGNSFTLTTSFGLVAHHLFGVWHGDKRLSEKHGEAYEVLKKRTSVIPFAAILDGRQKLPEEYYKEFLRLPYFVIAVITVGAYWSQPILQGASRYLKW